MTDTVSLLTAKQWRGTREDSKWLMKMKMASSTKKSMLTFSIQVSQVENSVDYKLLTPLPPSV